MSNNKRWQDDANKTSTVECKTGIMLYSKREGGNICVGGRETPQVERINRIVKGLFESSPIKTRKRRE